MPVDLQAVAGELRETIGSASLNQCRPQDAVDGVLPQFIVEPRSVEELASVLKIAGKAGLHVIPRGNATKLDWGNPPRGGQLIISTRRLNRVVEHAWGDMTATVEAGCTVGALRQTLLAHGQQLALDPLWAERATVGGVLATNDSGPLRIRYGSLRDLIIGLTLVLPDGTIAKSGGKVVKNVAGYDLPKLATGSLGTLGIIVQAIFRLHPIPKQSCTLTFPVRDFASMNALILSVLDSRLVPTGLQFRASSSSSAEVDVRFEGTPPGCDAQAREALMIAGHSPIESPPDVWNASESLWEGTEGYAVSKFSILPSNLGALVERVSASSVASSVSWQIVGQAVGVGLLRLEGANDGLLSVLRNLRSDLERQAGSLVVLRCPPEIKKQWDIWGNVGDALPVMRSIKAQFDPHSVLNPGRFVGGL